jgi:hypothetical protein
MKPLDTSQRFSAIAKRPKPNLLQEKDRPFWVAVQLGVDQHPECFQSLGKRNNYQAKIHIMQTWRSDKNKGHILSV